MITVKLEGEQKEKSAKFPKLMISDTGRIVFFTKDHCGYVIKNGHENIYDVGEFSEHWKMGKFTDYNEPITIQNVLED